MDDPSNSENPIDFMPGGMVAQDRTPLGIFIRVRGYLKGLVQVHQVKGGPRHFKRNIRPAPRVKLPGMSGAAYNNSYNQQKDHPLHNNLLNIAIVPTKETQMQQ
jgi:hypothetical protein